MLIELEKQLYTLNQSYGMERTLDEAQRDQDDYKPGGKNLS